MRRCKSLWRSGIFLGALGAFLAASAAAAPPGDARSPLHANADRMQARIEALSQYGLNEDGGSDRVAFSEHDLAARKFFAGLMRDAGLEVRIDTAGNLIGRRAGRYDERPPIMFGSHLDTVPNGGAYDGVVGSVGALEVMELLNEHAIVTDHPLQMIVFTDEEGGLTGSRAFIGDLGEEALDVVSHSGKTIREGIRYLGGDPARLDEAAHEKGDVKAFLELHIEQGGTLDDRDIDIGVVEGIVGIEWWEVVIEGFANHAGTTPMHGRRDAVLAGARFALAVNEVVTAEEGAQVGTVGKFIAEPGAPNVIPGRAVLSLELRDLSSGKIQRLFAQIQERAAAIAEDTGTKISLRHLDVAAVPALTDERIQAIIAAQAEALGYSYLHLPSGAGHDAQDMARIAPTGMIFVPSRGGISHAPSEFTSAGDMAQGASVLAESILAIDQARL
ncbi:MAG TPA: Zn-dependent hydrolase [Woeseiaceae bacterium]|nr:Zn-dependent hydrolase [Woeseiaceae bacterium]